MKKIVVLCLTIAVLFVLVGCGEETKDTAKDDKAKSENYFKNNIAETKDVKIEITKTKVIPVGETGNEYGEKPVIAFWYKVTNKSGEETDPMTAWLFMFKAYQDNNKDSLNELEVGSLPDENYTDTETEKIKKDGTVENAIAYELDDSTTPVKLVADPDLIGDKIGEQEFGIK